MSDFKAKITAELDTSKVEQQLKKLNDKKIKINADTGTAEKNINNVNNGMKSAQKTANTFGATMKKSLNIGSAAAITATGFRLISSAAKDAVEAVNDFDNAIMNIRMATNDSYEQASRLVQSYNELGKAIGATTTEVSQSADAWLRQGHSVKDTNTLIKNSMMLSKVAQLDSAEATDFLTSSMKGYRLAVEDVEGLIDKLTAVDLRAAVDAGGLAEGMSKVANTAANAGIEMDKLLGYLAATGEVTQESMSVIGNSMKSIFARMSDIKSGKLELIDEDGTTQTLSDVETTLNGIGIKLRESDNEFRNFGDVLDDLAAKWNNLSSVQREGVSKAFAGTY